MRQFGTYCLLQGKRVLRLLPRTLAVTALLALAAALAVGVFSARRDADASRRKAVVGVVADGSDPHLAAGLYALEYFDASRDELSFVMMDESEALERLRSGAISAYMMVPNGFFASAAVDSDPIRFVTLDRAAGLDTQLTAELAGAVALLVTETVNAQYGAIRYAVENAPGADPYAADQVLVDRYYSIVLGRDKIFDLEIVGLSDALSFNGYYLCGLSVAFLLLWGIGASPLFSRRSEELGALLRVRGFGALRQVLGEFAAYYLLMLLGALCAGAAALFFLRRGTVDVTELAGLSNGSLAGALAVSALALGAMQFFLYELAGAGTGGVLLQFLNAVVQGYAAGCFYPRSFFPDGLRALGSALPAGTALQYAGGVLSRQDGSGPAMAAWTAGFLALSALLRRLRQTR